MRGELLRVLNEYAIAKTEPLAKHPLAAWFQTLPTLLKGEIPQIQDLQVIASTGVGNWASVPWLFVGRSDIAPSPQNGLYVVYLFRGDMSGVVLSLNQGVTNVSSSSTKTRRATLRERAEAFRQMVQVPERLREAKIELFPTTPLGVDYEYGHVWGRTYDKDRLPEDDVLTRDLVDLISAYTSLNAADVRAITGDLSQNITPTFSALPATTSFADEPFFRNMEAALEYKRQLILFGPPGTGKTYTARRFAVSWLAETNQPGIGDPLSDSEAFRSTEAGLRKAQHSARSWWVTASPDDWRWETLFSEESEDFRLGRLQRNYADVRVGDLIFGYEATPTKRIVALARVIAPSVKVQSGEAGFTAQAIARIRNGPTYETMRGDPILSQSEPIRLRAQGTLFALSPAEQEALASLVLDANLGLEPTLNATGVDESPQLTICTFHASYTYEDFVEGYRPIPSGSSSLQLRLEDGLFKRICDTAKAYPSRRYVLIIDELNRANVSKVFGELMTILEADKRGLSVVLPQSRREFSIPDNVFLIATMNTADRSIALLDVALRRRFAFLEVAPNYELLEGVIIDGLDLASFLNILNERISQEFGHDKQLGHAFLLANSVAVTSPRQLYERFVFELLPLLQELSYADPSSMGRILGSAFASVDGATPERAAATVDALLQNLREGFPDAVRS